MVANLTGTEKRGTEPLTPREIIVAHAHNLAGELLLVPSLGGLVYAESGRHVGQKILQQIVEDPTRGCALIHEAMGILAEGAAVKSEIRKGYLAGDSFQKVAAAWGDHFIEVYHGGIDIMLDPLTLPLEIGSRLRKDPQCQFWEAKILQPYSGEDAYVHHTRALLLHLAHLFHNDSPSNATDAYVNYARPWFDENYLTLKAGVDVFTVTGDLVDKDLREKALALKIPLSALYGDGTRSERSEYFDSARTALADLSSMQRERRFYRLAVDQKLVDASETGQEQIVTALSSFGGRCIQVNEVMHKLLLESLNYVRLAAQRDNIGTDEVFGTILPKMGGRLQQMEVDRLGTNIKSVHL